MNGMADDLRATRALVLRGQCSTTYANDQVARAKRWLDGLGARRGAIHYAEEVAEVEEAMVALREVMRKVYGGRDRVRLLFVPERMSKTQAVLAPDKRMTNLMAVQHFHETGNDPGPLLKPERATLPSVEVLRHSQGWVNRRGRARVETAYELLIRGQHVLMGSRRYVMRQADWAVKCDAFGKLPEIETLRGLAKRRALYKIRKAKRLKRRGHRLYRQAQRALVNADARRREGWAMMGRAVSATIRDLLPEAPRYPVDR